MLNGACQQEELLATEQKSKVETLLVNSLARSRLWILQATLGKSD